MLIIVAESNLRRYVKTRRQHLWKQPSEGVIDSLLLPGHLQQIMRASIDMTHGLPIPILSMPQVAVVDGLLIPTPLEQGFSSLREYAKDWSPPKGIRGGGFSSLSDLISEATNGGKSQDLLFSKSGATGVANASNTLWYAAGTPAAGSNGAALAGGTDTTRATVGALTQTNPSGGDTLHITTIYMMPSIANNTLLLFDRIWHGAPAVSTVGDQTVTMTPTRYAGTGVGGSSIGNFVTLEIQANLGATGHSWRVTYVDTVPNAAENATAFAGLNAGIAPRLDVAANAQWFLPLNNGDLGVSDITLFNMGASVSGATNLVLGHPLGFIPQPVAQQMVVLDGINSAFNLTRVLDDACLSFFELYKLATTATQYNGMLKLVAG